MDAVFRYVDRSPRTVKTVNSAFLQEVVAGHDRFEPGSQAKVPHIQHAYPHSCSRHSLIASHPACLGMTSEWIIKSFPFLSLSYATTGNFDQSPFPHLRARQKQETLAIFVTRAWLPAPENLPNDHASISSHNYGIDCSRPLYFIPITFLLQLLSSTSTS